MKIPLMVTADYAMIDPITGKLHILGVFRNIYSNNFPVTHPRMCMAVKIEGDPSDKPNPHKLHLTLADEDGKEIANIEGQFEMPDSELGIPPECNFVMELNSVVFQKAGHYRFYVQLNDGEVEKSIAIQVMQQEN